MIVLFRALAKEHGEVLDLGLYPKYETAKYQVCRWAEKWAVEEVWIGTMPKTVS